jgi:hypothetical protein
MIVRLPIRKISNAGRDGFFAGEKEVMRQKKSWAEMYSKAS